MTEIVQGLFGVSPEQLQMQQQQALEARAQQYAQLSPQEQSTAAIYKGASQLGGALGGMLGGVDPVQQQASKIASVLQGADQTTAEGMAALAQRFSDADMPQQAQMAAAKAQELKKAESAQNLEAARAKYFEGGGARGAAKVAGAVGKIRPEAYEKESVQSFYESVDAGKPDYSLLIPKDKKDKVLVGSPEGKLALDEGLVPGTPEFGTRVKELSQEKANKPSASIVKELATVAGTVASLQQSGAKLDKLIPTIKQMDLGLVSNYFRAGAAALGIKLEDSQKFDSLQRAVRAESNKLLNLAKGVQTKLDAERIDALFTSPDTWKNADSLTNALEDMQQNYKDILVEEQAKQQVLSSGGRAAPVPKAAAPAAPANVDWAAAFAKQQALNPAWKNFTLEQFKQKAGAK